MSTPPQTLQPQPVDSTTLFVSLFALAATIILFMFILNYCVYRHSHASRHLTLHVNSTTPLNRVIESPNISVNIDRALLRFPVLLYQSRVKNEILDSDIALNHLEANTGSNKDLSECALGDMCAVCLESFDCGQEIRILPCCHQFHSQVIHDKVEIYKSVLLFGSRFN